MPATDEQIVQKLRELLKDADMDTITERKLRQTLEKEFGEDLTSKKRVISQEVERFLMELEAEGNEEDEDGDNEEDDADSKAKAQIKGKKSRKEERPEKKKRKGSTMGGSRLSPEMSAFLGGAEIMQRTQVVKKIWEHIKANDLQDPANKQKIMLDDKMRTLFKEPLTMFSMNKQLSKHVFAKDPDAPKEKKPKKERAEGEPKVANGFQKPVRVSPELGSWLGGVSEISRPQITSAFWKYVKENELQDPANKRNVLCDAKLKELTGQDSLGFGFMKFLAPHIYKD